MVPATLNFQNADSKLCDNSVYNNSGQLGPERPGKVSASQAEKHLVVFKKSGTNIEEHFRDITAIAQPYFLAVGPQKNSVYQYFIVLDQHAIPCKSTSSLGAFDELFKARFCFWRLLQLNAKQHVHFHSDHCVQHRCVAEVRARLLS
ncbi:uncharacterized protein LOC113112079 isoform X2 [Tachysurus ichikawai]